MYSAAVRSLCVCLLVLISSSLCRAEKEWFPLNSIGVWRSFHTEPEWLKLVKEIRPYLDQTLSIAAYPTSLNRETDE
jgi:hypothetical protein